MKKKFILNTDTLTYPALIFRRNSLLATVFTVFFVLCSCSISREPAPKNTADSKPKTDSVPSILIVSDKKGLEWNVAGSLERYYSEKKIIVRNIIFSDFPLYRDLDNIIIVLLNVVKNGRIHPDIEPYLQLKGKDENGRNDPLFFISTISGREWGKENRLVDGISGASEMSDAAPITERIITTIDSRIN